MPQIAVNGYPFLFTGSTIPGISPMAVREGTVYYYSSCARGIYSFPLAALSDNRLPYRRAADIQLVAPTPSDVAVEELLDFSFNHYNSFDSYLYAADPLNHRVNSVDLTTRARQSISIRSQRLTIPSPCCYCPTL